MRTIIIIAALIISKPLMVLADMSQFDEKALIALVSITLTLDMFDYFKNDRKK